MAITHVIKNGKVKHSQGIDLGNGGFVVNQILKPMFEGIAEQGFGLRYTANGDGKNGQVNGYIGPVALTKEDTTTPTKRTDNNGYTGNAGYEQIVQAGKGTPEEINTAHIDNFIPNTAKGGNNMANEEDKSWWDKYGNDVTKTLSTVATIGANLYNQQQQNKFNANEAKKQRDWEAEMSNTAFQRQAQDMKLAGVNPVASADMGGASTPSGAQASGTTPYYADPLTIANTALTEAQIANVKANTELTGKQSGKTEMETKAIEIDTEIKKAKAPLEMALTEAQTEEEKTQARKNLAEYNEKVKELDKMDAEIALLKEQGKYTKAQRKMQERLTKGIQTREWINTISNAVGQIGGVATKAAAVGQNALAAFAI